jgi:MFS superfamily sulfate permease-like transporter
VSAQTSCTGRRALLPAAGWLADYSPGWLKADLVAGMTLAAYAIPGTATDEHE